MVVVQQRLTKSLHSLRLLLVDPAKIKAVVDWPVPKSVQEVRGFFGLTGYYRQFVRGYASNVGPLTELLKKGGFSWGLAADESFQRLKEAMTKTPVLYLPNFERPFRVETDASGCAMGAILTQDKYPIAYFSKKLPPHYKKASAYCWEMYAITAAVRRWRP
ncbi:PREDICTED: uncharacterized protein LOC109178953 [Ipomoea nil]|uniref:uncharacterized protein LOC109178953 n=1 Tax=Ipomoea nil TaxID=35883 RepID=UPI000901483E|nr:PREDICTED: uncharacterized protein LOC109178953 [Ipomoea nil]